MELLITHTSPYVRKVRIALREKNLMCTETVSPPFEETSKVPERNPLGKIPVLITDDGRSIFDSVVILQFLEGMKPDPALYPKDFGERMRALTNEALADGICDATVAIFLERRRPSEKVWQSAVDNQRLKIERGLKHFSSLVKNREFVVGNQFGISDIAVLSALGYIRLRTPEILDGPEHLEIQRWADRHAERPSVSSTVPPGNV